MYKHLSLNSRTVICFVLILLHWLLLQQPDDPDRWPTPLEDETLQQACLLQRLPEHAAGFEEARTVLHLWVPELTRGGQPHCNIYHQQDPFMIQAYLSSRNLKGSFVALQTSDDSWGYLCAGCKYTVHGRCANRNPAPCTRTYVKSKKETGVCQCLHDNIYSDTVQIRLYPLSECSRVDIHPTFRFQRTTGWVGTATRRSVINARRRSRASKAWRANAVCGATRWWESIPARLWFMEIKS